ncbi:deoxyribodipyrimidine photo-lyase-like [Liolophura sinensis]|uniref:deoxyribodipyrimidine photo-lyase-like n=1 Tax=Liolophura sinensis TaxID=3198878 RepID=UPI00315806E1
MSILYALFSSSVNFSSHLIRASRLSTHSFLSKDARAVCTMPTNERSKKQTGSKKRKAEPRVDGQSPPKKIAPTSSDKETSNPSENLVKKIEEARKNVARSIADFKFNKKRVRMLSEAVEFEEDNGAVVYWMSRDQRVQGYSLFCFMADNWAFLYAQRLALKMEVPLHVCFCLVSEVSEATIRHFGFMLKGLQEVEQECQRLDIQFHLLIGYAQDVLPDFVVSHKIMGVVTDFSPLRVPMEWVENVRKNLPKTVPFCQVDAHNIVPCWEASPKLEYGARTIRKKIHDQLSGYLTGFPPVCKHPYKAEFKAEPIDWEAAEASLEVDRSVTEVDWAIPGTEGGLRMLESFCNKRLKYFNADRNNPNKAALSNLSPWIHFGQISVQRCILTVKEYRSKYKESVDGYIEEAVIRRELADNFCFYNKNYDKIEGAYDWAKKSLELHKGDKREYLYSREKLEAGKTHDDLWNAAQIQMVREGKMHGFLRMYWAKKILEWTESPEQALVEAIYLNDKYELDGRDPNGYVGCMWSICGIHDQGWAERPVFGKIRYMNYNGCKRKFDVPEFVRQYKAKKA